MTNDQMFTAAFGDYREPGKATQMTRADLPPSLTVARARPEIAMLMAATRRLLSVQDHYDEDCYCENCAATTRVRAALNAIESTIKAEAESN